MSNETRAPASRSARNRRAYAKSKAAQDHALLRLRAGDAARLDAACAAFGMGRAQFCKERLVPLLEAAARQLREAEAASAPGGAPRPSEPAAAEPAVAAEFDALFATS